jgi:hypothetical protein
MRYNDLHKTLRKLESRISGARPQQIALDALVRNIPDRTPVQGFGLSRHTQEREGDDLTVIVAVGINYTQGKMKCPRDGLRNAPPDPEAVVDGLGYHRNSVEKLFNAYRKSREEWANNRCASSAAIDVPRNKDFHLVMTNFCLWITNDAWAELKRKNENLKEELLRNNPLFNGKSAGPPAWSHLSHLAEELHQAKAIQIWVPHGIGIDSDVPPLFFKFSELVTKTGKAIDWIFAPNLSRPFDYSGKTFPCQLPRLKQQRRPRGN